MPARPDRRRLDHGQSGVGLSTGLTGWWTSPMTMAGPSEVGESGQRGRRARRPTPTPSRANQIPQVLMRSWPARNTATPGANVVPGDHSRVHVRGVVPHQDRHGIAQGERSRPRDRAQAGHAADGDKDADQSVRYGAPRRRVQVARLGGRLSLPAGIHSDGSDPTQGGGACDTGRDAGCDPPPLHCAAPAAQRGGRSRLVPLRWRGSGTTV